MAKLISSVRTQLMYRSAAYNLWKSSYGPMIPGLLNGYAVTCFNSELELRTSLTNYKYTELIKHCIWKIGTAEITAVRLEEMFKMKRPLNNFDEIWDRYMIPFNKRLSKYSGDTKSLQPGQCAWMKDILIKKFIENANVAILMIPLIIGYKGQINHLEEQLSEMIDRGGGDVYNHKTVQKEKDQKAQTAALIGLPDMKADKQLKLSPTLQKMGFEVHYDFAKRTRK